jgi:hypothetical protein
MPTVEIRVAGTIGPLISAGLPGFTVMSGSVEPDHRLTDILALLARHGVRPIDTRLFPDPPPA